MRTIGDEADHRALVEYLAERDEPCPACGYSLRGLTGEACPECGETLRLRVGIVEPRVGLFVTGLVGLAAGAGFHGVIAVFGVIYGLMYGQHMQSRDVWMLALYVGLCVIGAAGIAAWVRGRGWVRRRSRLGRAVLVGACWGYFLFTVAALSAFTY